MISHPPALGTGNVPRSRIVTPIINVAEPISWGDGVQTWPVVGTVEGVQWGVISRGRRIAVARRTPLMPVRIRELRRAGHVEAFDLFG